MSMSYDTIPEMVSGITSPCYFFSLAIAVETQIGRVLYVSGPFRLLKIVLSLFWQSQVRPDDLAQVKWSVMAPCWSGLSAWLERNLCQRCLLPMATPTDKQVQSLPWQLAPICPLLVSKCDSVLILVERWTASHKSHMDLKHSLLKVTL